MSPVQNVYELPGLDPAGSVRPLRQSVPNQMGQLEPELPPFRTEFELRSYVRLGCYLGRHRTMRVPCRWFNRLNRA